MLMWMPAPARPFGAGRVFENRQARAGSSASWTGAGFIVPAFIVDRTIVDRGQCEY